MSIYDWDTFQNSGLPDIRIGPNRSRDQLFAKGADFNGPYTEQELFKDGATYWDCTIICNQNQTRVFQNFCRNVVRTDSGFFTKKIKTETGVKQQLCRIVSGIPQARQIAFNAWAYEFTLMAARLNTETTLAPLPDDIAIDLIPTLWRRFDVSSAFAGYDPGICYGVDASSDGSFIVAGFASGYLCRSFNKGVSFEAMTQYAGSGAPAGNYPVAVLCSSDGAIVFVAYYKGNAAISKDYGRTFTPMPKYLNSGAPDDGFSEVICAAMSADGSTIYVGCSSGYASKTSNTGASWTPLTRGVGLGLTTSHVTSVACSANGSIVLFGGNKGRMSRSTNGGASFSTLTQTIEANESDIVKSIYHTDDFSKIITSTIAKTYMSNDSGVNFNITVSSLYGAYGNDIAISPSGFCLFGFDDAGGRYSYGPNVPLAFINKEQPGLYGEIPSTNIISFCTRKSVWYAASDDGLIISDRASPQPNLTEDFTFKRSFNITSGTVPSDNATIAISAAGSAAVAMLTASESGPVNQVYRSIDGALSWQQLSINDSGRLVGESAVSDDGTKIAIAFNYTGISAGSVVMYSSDGGVTFKKIRGATSGVGISGTAVTIKKIDVNNDGVILLLLSDGKSYETVPGGGTVSGLEIAISMTEVGAGVIPNTSNRPIRLFNSVYYTHDYVRVSSVSFTNINAGAVFGIVVVPGTSSANGETFISNGGNSQFGSGYYMTGVYPTGDYEPTTVYFNKLLASYASKGFTATCVDTSKQSVGRVAFAVGVSDGTNHNIRVSFDYGDTWRNFVVYKEDGTTPLPYSKKVKLTSGTAQLVKCVATVDLNGYDVVLAVAKVGPLLVRGSLSYT